MFYSKNVPGWERALRIVAGLAMLAGSLVYFGATPVGWVAGIAGAMAMMTGLIGFCPACAMVGRKLKP
jgi:hypothetical protein